MPTLGSALRQVTVMVTVRELELALVFYRDILGLSVVDSDHNVATLTGDDGTAAVVLQATHGRGPSHTHGDPIARLLFSPEAFEEIRTRLLKAAFAFRILREDPLEVVARDLDGNDVLLGIAS